MIGQARLLAGLMLAAKAVPENKDLPKEEKFAGGTNISYLCRLRCRFTCKAPKQLQRVRRAEKFLPQMPFYAHFYGKM